MHCRAIMGPPPAALIEGATVNDALRLMIEQRTSHIPFVDADRRFRGVIDSSAMGEHMLPRTLRGLEDHFPVHGFLREDLPDLVRRIRRIAHEPATLLLNEDVFTVTPDAPIIDALMALRREAIEIFVLDEERRLTGSINIVTLIAALEGLI